MSTTEHEPKAAAHSLVNRAAANFSRYRGGDVAGIDQLVDAVTPALWHVARGAGLDRAAAEDVVQATWLALLRHADAVQDPQAVLAWLVTTCRREAWRVSARSRRATLVEPGTEIADADEDQPMGALAAASPEELALRSEDHQRLWQHVSGLSERCQHLLRIIAVGDRPDYAAIAEALGMPVGSIGPTRGRCLATLRTSLAADPGWSLT